MLLTNQNEYQGNNYLEINYCDGSVKCVNKCIISSPLYVSLTLSNHQNRSLVHTF